MMMPDSFITLFIIVVACRDISLLSAVVHEVRLREMTFAVSLA